MMTNTLDSHQLQVFVVLARTLNMRLAAAELGQTTSAVSHCLKSLEHDIGCQLMLREPRSLSLSPAGRIFLAEARQILDQMDSARTRLRIWTGQTTNHLRIASGSAIARFVLGPALRELRESFPALTVTLTPTHTQANPAPATPSAAENPTQSAPDLLLLPDPEPAPGLVATPLGEDELRFYAHPLHPWVVRRKADRLELERHRLILPTSGSPTALRIRDYFARENIRLQSFIEVSDEDAAMDLILLGLGVGILPRWLAAEALSRGTIAELPLGRKRLRRSWFALHRSEPPLSLAGTLLVNLCAAAFRKSAPAEEDRIPFLTSEEPPSRQGEGTLSGPFPSPQAQESESPPVAF